MYSRLALLVLAMMVFGASQREAFARGDGVLVFNRLTWAYSLDSLRTHMTAAGASRVDDVTEWPASLSDYRVVILLLPHQPLTASQQSDLAAFIADHGFLVAVDDYYEPAAQVLNPLLQALGATSQFSGGAAIECAPLRVRAGHPLTANVSSLVSAGVHTIAAGPGAVTLTDSSTIPVIVLDGSILLIGDTNIIQTYPCGEGDNGAFFENIFRFANTLASSPVLDAGVEPGDANTSPEDAGVEAPDAATRPADPASSAPSSGCRVGGQSPAGATGEALLILTGLIVMGMRSRGRRAVAAR